MKTVIGTLLAAILLSGCLFPKSGGAGHAKKPAPSQLVAFETLNRGFYSMIGEPGQSVIKNPQDWKDLWSKVNAHQLTPYPLPDVNFQTHWVIGVFIGNQPSGGYEAEIKKIFETEDRVVVHYTQSVPSLDCMVSEVVTAPYHLVKVPVLKKTVYFQPEKVSLRCD